MLKFKLGCYTGAYSKTKRWKQTNSSTGFKNQGAPKIY